MSQPSHKKQKTSASTSSSSSQGSTLHLSYAAPSDSAPQPSLALFPSSAPPAKSTPFTAYEHKADKRKLVAAETEDMEYEGTEDDHAATYMLAVHDPSTSTLTLVPAPVHTFTPRIKSLKATAAAASAANTAFEKRTALGAAFGTKKSIRALNIQERNRLSEASFGDPSASLVSSLQSTISKNSASLPSADDVKNTADLARPIPPPNMQATTPGECYSIDDVVPRPERAALGSKISAMQAATTQKERQQLLPYRRSSWLNSRLASLFSNSASPSSLNAKDRERLEVLIHLAYLLQFRQVTKKSPSVSLPLLTASLFDPPSVVVDALVARYTEAEMGGKRKVTGPKEVKVLCWFLVGVLWVDKWSTEVQGLASDLGMTSIKVGDIFKSLGCSLVAPTEAEKQAYVHNGKAATLGEAGKIQKATLKVPLTFPVARKGMVKR